MAAEKTGQGKKEHSMKMIQKARGQMKNIRRDEKGAAMVVVLCVLTVFLALALSLLFAASTLVSTARNGITGSRCKIEAVTFSDRITEDLANEKSELNQYVKDEISTQNWEANVEKEFEAASPVGEEDSGTGSGYTMTVSMHWEEPEGLAAESAYSYYSGAKLILTVTCTRGSASHKLKSEYTLACSAADDASREPEDAKWNWTLAARG